MQLWMSISQNVFIVKRIGINYDDTKLENI